MIRTSSRVYRSCASPSRCKSSPKRCPSCCASPRARRPPVRMPSLVAGALWLALATKAGAQPSPYEEELLDLSLEELMQVEVTSATKSSLALNEAPAIITVINAH